MSEAMTLLIQAGLAVLGGLTAACRISVSKGERLRLRFVCMWILRIFFCFWGYSIVRCVLLCGNQLAAYETDGYLLPVDILLTIGFVLFSCIDRPLSSGGTKTDVMACTVIFLYFSLGLIKLIAASGNINAAIYQLFLPVRIVCLGFAVVVPRLLADRFRNQRAASRGGSAPQKRLTLEISVASLVVVTFFLYPVFETLFTNAGEFIFTIKQVWLSMVFLNLAVFCVVVGFLLLLEEKKRKLLTGAVWAVTVCAYLQEMFFNRRLYLMDGKRVQWDNGLKISNFLIWGGVVTILAVLCFVLKRVRQKMITTVSVVLCLMQITGLLSLLPSYQADTRAGGTEYQNYLSTKGLYETASKENVVIFVLDTYDVDYVEEVLAQKPDFLMPLKGFLYFPDMVSQFSRTFPSIPYMLTEEKYFYEKPLSEYVEDSYMQCSFWTQLKENSYQYYLFEHDENIIGEQILITAGNFVDQGTVCSEKISVYGCAEAMIRIGNYRLFPYFLKNYYVYSASTVNDLVVQERVLEVPAYEEDDVQLYEGLKRNGLCISSEEKAIRLIHMNGAHAPYTMTEDGRRVKEEDCTPVQQYMGSMNVVYAYLAALQELGLYEQSLIIITADHGENYVTEQLEENTNPILFIKPFGAGMDKPMEQSDIYASQNDVLPTICAALDLSYDANWGLDLFNPQGMDKERVRYHYYTVVENTAQTKTKTYRIRGSSRDFKNWEATDEYHEFGKYY